MYTFLLLNGNKYKRFLAFFLYLFCSSKFIDLVNVMVVAVLFYLFFDAMNIDAMGDLNTAPA